MKTKLVMLAVFTAAVAPSAHAAEFSIKTLSDAKIGKSKAELLAQMRHSSSVVSFFTKNPHKWMVHPRKKNCWGMQSKRARRICDRARQALYAHRWLYSVAHERYHELYVPKPKPVPSYAPGHVAGWLCIHSQEAAWNAQTGNGYYGGLQMTYGWEGLVANAALLSPAQQMAAAEAGYARSGYSSAWMASQWPNTYPPCAGFFG